jgi:hypothetical protein
MFFSDLFKSTQKGKKYKKQTPSNIMSLNDLDEGPEDAIEIKKKKLKLPKIGKSKLFLAILVVGIVIGIVLGHYYIEPFFSENIEEFCLEQIEILNEENNCLHKSIPNSQELLNSCEES